MFYFHDLTLNLLGKRNLVLKDNVSETNLALGHSSMLNSIKFKTKLTFLIYFCITRLTLTANSNGVRVFKVTSFHRSSTDMLPHK